MEPLEIGKHLIIDPRVCFGKLTFKGTRVPVETVLVSLTEGGTIKSILESWPFLKREAVEEAIQLAAASWPEIMQTEMGNLLIRRNDTELWTPSNAISHAWRQNHGGTES